MLHGRYITLVFRAQYTITEFCTSSAVFDKLYRTKVQYAYSHVREYTYSLSHTPVYTHMFVFYEYMRSLVIINVVLFKLICFHEPELCPGTECILVGVFMHVRNKIPLKFINNSTITHGSTVDSLC